MALARGLNTRRRQTDQVEIRVQDKRRLDREDNKAQVLVGGTRISTEAKSELRRDIRTSGQTNNILSHAGTRANTQSVNPST